MIRINCVTYFFICVSCTASFIIQENLTELSILHINDFHARYEETNIDSGLCKNKNCIGGFSRMYARIMKVFDKNPNLILLNAGDSFEGTLWYNVHKWNVTQYFLNKLPIDASTLGNHEFDDKIDGLVPFLRHLNAPVVVANIDATEEPVVKNLLNKSVIIERRGIKIGIIGVILSTTDELVNVGNIILLKELDSVNAEAARLVKEEGVFTNIVLSHCGYDAEKEIARKSSSKISLIVGGHSHSFLYTGEPVPGPDQPVGPYPTVVKNSEGKTVLIVQASSYSKYLGNLTISFNMNGEPVGWVGNSIFLDSTLSQDEEINEELLLWKQEVDRQGNKVIGSTLVRLKQSSCLTAECLMGNVITDAMVFAYTDSPVAESWTNGPIAIMHAKGLRSDIDVGNITYNDIVTAQPFANTIDIGEVTGKHLKEILESSVSTDNINLLQVSGMQVVYNLTKVEGSRVTCLKLRCRKCNAPVYENFDENKTYPIILPSFLANGGFGFSLIKTYLRNRQLGEYDPVDNVSTTCEGNNCIGGFSRLFSAIMELKKHKPNSIVLNAGDNFQGTLWYIVHKWNVTQHFLNKLPLDAITLGNHEFDDGIDGLVPYLQHIQAPVIVSNINTNLEPRLDNLYRRSVIIERDGKKIGIIGALTTTTSSTSRTENVLFANELDSVYNEAKRLEQEVFANIVLSHCGYNLDLEMARNSSSKIRVIVGGHTDTFLYTGSPIPGPDKPSGPYPTIVLNKSGDKVLVVQASAYTKYLGNLTVFFDNFANVVGWDGAPIFLDDNNIHSDVRIDAELALWKEAVNLQGKKIVGTTINTMLNQPCRSEECPLGNFATDAMLYNYQSTLDNFCNNTVIAAIHAGGIRAGIEEGNITFYQLTTTFPFQDTINICDIKGEHLKEILESFINNDHLKFPHLLQMAGLHVVFNISNPEGGRVETLKTCCSQFENISCEDIILEKDYRVLLPTFLTDTSFNPLFQKYIKNKIIGDLDSNVYTKYLKIKSPLMQGVEGRIKIIQ